MKKMLGFILLLWLGTILLPVLAPELSREQAEDGPEAEVEMTEPERSEAPPDAGERLDAAIRVDVMVNGEKNSFSLEEYLPGVVAAEMPASFPEDALRAQAAAARSFILYRTAHPPADGVHDGVPLCNDPAHCKGYIPIEGEAAAAAAFGGNWETALERVRQAAEDTDGVVLTYEGKPALAAFHAISGGRTESAEDVWGSPVPYLIEVDSPGEETAAKYLETVRFDRAELREMLLQAWPDAELGEDPETWLTDIRRTPAGMIQTASLGGIPVTGMELRRLLSLNSADFTLTAREDTVEITTRGYGHGVGMSQYGARAMALSGADWREILLHYYPGCTLSRMESGEELAKD